MMLAEDRERLARIETNTESLLALSKDHETRIRKCEGFQGWCLGAAAGVSGTITGLVTLLKGMGHA